MRLPPGSDPDKASIGYMTALHGFPIEAINRGIQRFLRGECEDVSPKFCPYPPELAKIVRTTVYAPTTKVEHRGYVPSGSLPPFMVRAEKKRAEYADRPILHTDINFDQWKRLSQAREVPTGAVWVASLGTVYGPKP